MAKSNTTTDHEEIRKWVEDRGGRPAHVKRTGKAGDLGILRIDYPGFSGEDTLEEVDWDDWFQMFEENNLAFVYDTGKKSRFSKLVTRPKGSAGGGGRSAKKSSAKKKSAAKKSGAGRKTSTAKKTAGKKTAASRSGGASKKTAAKKTTAKKTTAKRTPAKKRTATTKNSAARKSSGR
ncbi:MAG: hypothetical protein JWP97_1124 [Labilithrix sp.]|nr:hypothetical protein [Labilithrix sp.]